MSTGVFDGVGAESGDFWAREQARSSGGLGPVTLGVARRMLGLIVSDCYGSRLSAPRLRSSARLRGESVDGQYSPADRLITVAEELLADPERLTEVLQHEAAHHGACVLEGDRPSHPDHHTEAFRRHLRMIQDGRTYRPGVPSGGARTTSRSRNRGQVSGRRWRPGHPNWHHHGAADCRFSCERHQVADPGLVRSLLAAAGTVTR